MDIYLNRTLELGHKLPYGAPDGTLGLSRHTYYVANPGRPGASFPVRLRAAVYSGDIEVFNLVAEVQPATKAQDLGYVLKFEAALGAHEPDRIVALHGSHADAEQVGELSFTATGVYLEDQDVQVAEAHRRKGIATAMYQHAESLTGKQFLSRQGEVLPVDAAALWAHPDRPFGVDALYSQPRRLLWVNLGDLLPASLKHLPQVVFDAERFTASATGQRCIEMANGGAGPRVGLQDARIRGLVVRGVDGLVQSFVNDAYAPPKLFRSVQCGQHPPLLSLSNAKGLPDTSISPPLAALTADAREQVTVFIAARVAALAELHALDALHPELKVLSRLRQHRHEQGDVGAIGRSLQGRFEHAMTVLARMVDEEADFRASQM